MILKWYCIQILYMFLQGRIQPAWLGGGAILVKLVVKSNNSFFLLGGMQHTSQNYCDKIIEDKLSWVLFSEL